MDTRTKIVIGGALVSGVVLYFYVEDTASGGNGSKGYFKQYLDDIVNPFAKIRDSYNTAKTIFKKIPNPFHSNPIHSITNPVKSIGSVFHSIHF